MIDRRIAFSRKRFKNCVLRVFPPWAKAVNCVKTQIGIDLRYITVGAPPPSVMLLAPLTNVGRAAPPACVRVRVVRIVGVVRVRVRVVRVVRVRVVRVVRVRVVRVVRVRVVRVVRVRVVRVVRALSRELSLIHI